MRLLSSGLFARRTAGRFAFARFAAGRFGRFAAGRFARDFFRTARRPPIGAVFLAAGFFLRLFFFLAMRRVYSPGEAAAQGLHERDE